jgi:predicted ester cyclase
MSHLSHAPLFEDFYNAADVDQALSIAQTRLAEDFVDNSPWFDSSADKAGFLRTLGIVHLAFRQKYKVKQVWQDGDTLIADWTAEVTHIGEFLGISATQKQFALRGITIYQIRDGLVTAHWEQFDQMVMLKALGILE